MLTNGVADPSAEVIDAASETTTYVAMQPQDGQVEDAMTSMEITEEESGDEADKTKVIKMLPKKSQTVTQEYKCNSCNYTSPKRKLLICHLKCHSQERPHKCSVCERGFKTLATLKNHFNTHKGTKPHRCKFCDSRFTTSGELIRHVRYRHTHQKPHKCTECDYASVESSKLKRHMRCHTSERPYQCPHCKYASSDTFKLKRHLRKHTGEKPYECDICHKRFTQSNSLKAHKLIHSGGDKPVFQCKLCHKTYLWKTGLRSHVQKLHKSDKPLKCKHCEKSFADRYTHKIHNKTHKGEKCFKCELCPYASISERHLKSHMLIHTDSKPYQCDQCDQSFRQKQLLRRHQNLYHNPNYVPPPTREKTLECAECGRAFRHKGNLIRHMAIHDPESSAQKKALALKLGRQKKIQIIDGQQVEVMAGEDEDEDEDMDGEMKAVDGQDGQQYVVPEVIQQQIIDGQQVEVMAGEDEDEDEDMDGEMKAVDGQDGQQYVVPEVIQQQIIDGQQVEVMAGEDEDKDEDTDVEMKAVDGQDGQQYVVPEVIQLQIIDGQQVEVMAGEDEEKDEDTDVEMKAVDGQDGQQYVVPEVIQLQIIDGQQVEVMAGEDEEKDEDTDVEMKAVDGQDGQQYVVPEVIQLQMDNLGFQHEEASLAMGGEAAPRSPPLLPLITDGSRLLTATYTPKLSSSSVPSSCSPKKNNNEVVRDTSLDILSPKCLVKNNNNTYCSNTPESPTLLKKHQQGLNNLRSSEGKVLSRSTTLPTITINNMVPSVSGNVPYFYPGFAGGSQQGVAPPSPQPHAENRQNMRRTSRYLRESGEGVEGRGATLRKLRAGGWNLAFRCFLLVSCILAAAATVALVVYMTTGMKSVPMKLEGVQDSAGESDLSLPTFRHCDECLTGEVCVALGDEEVPTFRQQHEPNDPTGCGGPCRINTELCHKLDVDAFRCLDDSYCLSNEWRCANQLCIPQIKRCDGLMNCYDHTGEYDCESRCKETMARRAQMLELLQLSSLDFLLEVKVTHTAPVSDSSNINNSDGGDVFSEKHNDADHTVAPGDSVAAVTVHDVNNMSKEEMDVHMVTETVEDTSSAEENLDKDVGSISIKPEDEAGVTEESREVLKVNTDKPNDSLSIRSEDDASAADGSLAVSQVNTDKQEESLVTKTGENGTTESSNAGMHENHTVIETEDDTSAEDTDDAVSNENMEKDEDTITNKTGENTNDAESKENIEKDNDSGKDASTSDSQEGSEENMSKHEVKAIEGNPSKEEIVTAMAEDEINEKSEEFLETFKDNKVEKDAVESSDKESEKNKENEAAEETALKTDDTSEDEEKSNEQMLSEHGTGLDNSSEEISDAENEAGDIEVNENQNSTHEGSHVTSSPLARLSVPLSDNHHVDKNEHNGDKDASTEDHESNPSVEETAEKETGSPDELIENDSVDSEVIKSDNKTAALGKIMPITGAEKDAQNTDESLHDTSNDSETVVIPTESGETEGKTPVADQDINNKNEEEETTTNEAPKIAHETKSEEIDLNGKLLDGDKDDDDKDDGDDEEQNEKHNFLDKDDMLPKELDSSSKKNENALYVSEGTFNVDVTENPSDEEGSGIALHMEGFTSHGDSAHKDTFDTSSQEKHEAENRKEEKEGNQDDDVVASEKEEAKLSKETDHHTYDFGESGSGHEEEKPENLGKQDNNGTNDVEDGDGSGSHALLGHYEDEIASEEATTKSNDYSVVYHVPVVDDNEESSTENSSKSPAPENETSTEIASFESPDDQNESGDHLKEENLVQNNTNVQVMSLSPTHAPDESDNHLMEFDGSGDDDTTTPVAIIIHADIIDDNMAVSSKEMDLVNSSLIGEASPAFQEKPVEKVVSSQSAAAPPPPNTESPCTAGEENEDCLLQSNKPHEDTGGTNILEDDDEVALEPTKGAIHTESTTNDDLKEHYLYTTPAVKVSIEEESSQESIAVDLNKPLLHSNEERKSTTIAPETKDITESIEEHEAIDNETTNIGAPDTIVEHPLDESGIKEMSGKIRAANVNELGVSGQENPDDLGEPEALDSSSASGSYVVLGCIMAVVVVLLAYAAIKSRRERGTSVGTKRHSEVAGDDDGTELKDMKKALLTPEAPHDDQNCDIEANTKPLMEKDGNEEDEGKETIIKQNGTLELSEPSRDIESQVDSSTAENPPKTAPTSKKPEERNGLSEVVVEKPPMTNGKADSLITHPVAAKVKVIENEDSIAKMPVIINRGSNSPPH